MKDLNQRANQFQYLFIGGILSELLRQKFFGSYFQENKKIFEEELGIEKVSIFYPSSNDPSPIAAGKIKHFVDELLTEDPRPLVIFAHSKATLDCLWFGIHFMDYFEQKEIEHVFLMHGSLNGSGVMDFIFGHPKSKRSRLSAPVFKSIKGLESLFKDNIHRDFPPKGELYAKLKDHYSYILGGRKRTREVIPIIKLGHRVLKNKGLNDGLVQLENQYFEEMPFPTYFYHADHGEFWVSAPLSKKCKKEKLKVCRDLILLTLKEKTEIFQPIEDFQNIYGRF